MVGAVVWFIGSALLVDLIGYWLHRWSHRPSSGPIYRAHMTHHVVNYPPGRFFSSEYRSSRHDSLAIWFAPFFVTYSLGVVLLGLPHHWAGVAGAALTATLSSVAHDMTHITGSIMWRKRALLGISVRHHAHHSKMGKNFGIVLPWWDRLFGTRLKRSSSSRGRLPWRGPGSPE